jgi:hypothetical protein
METRLHLSADQTRKLSGILDETKAGYHAVRQRYDPDMKALQEGQRNRIREMLSEQQRQEYERMLAERDRKMKEGRKGPPGGF